MPASTFRRWVRRGIVRPSTFGLDDEGNRDECFTLADVVVAFLVRSQGGKGTLASRTESASQQLVKMSETHVRELLIPANLRSAVEIDPGRLDGAPVVRGTRVPTALFSGSRLEAFSGEFPAVTNKQARAAADFERLLDEAAC